MSVVVSNAYFMPGKKFKTYEDPIKGQTLNLSKLSQFPEWLISRSGNTGGFPKSLENLKVLKMNDNNIQHIDKYSFKNLVNLEEIYLQNNYINSLHQSIFMYNKKLKIVDISGNFFIRKPDGLEHVKNVIFENQKVEFISNKEIMEMKNDDVLEVLSGSIASVGININQADEDVMKKLAKLYTMLPKRLLMYFGWEYKEKFDSYLNNKCDNLFVDPSPVFLIDNIDGKEYTFCFSREEMDDIKTTGYNPYTGTMLPVELIDGTIQELDLSQGDKESYEDCENPREIYHSGAKLAKLWQREIFTMGNIYFKIPLKTRREWFKSVPCKPTSFLRGMSFRTKELFDSFITSCKNEGGDGIKSCNFRTDTYSSWTNDFATARYFTTGIYGGKYGVILRTEKIQPQKMLVSFDDGLETLLLPGLYKCDVFIGPEYDPDEIIDPEFHMNRFYLNE